MDLIICASRIFQAKIWLVPVNFNLFKIFPHEIFYFK
jgi:hypothetical protein